jgi:hypothetical protein
MLALAEFKAANETDELSYYGVTGIDAYPLDNLFPIRLVTAC